MPTRITLDTPDGHCLTAWRSDPVGEPRGGVVALHAVYGLTAHIGEVCDRWASAGYAAIAPALFDRVGMDLVHPYSRAGGDAGRACFAALSESQILTDVAACAKALRDRRPRIISGFCSGGSWAWVAAARLDFDAQVNFYGSHVAKRLDHSPRCPTIMHYGDNDHVVPLADIERIRAAHPALRMEIYPNGRHAFFNPEQDAYNAEAARLSWQRSLAFLDEVRANVS